MITLPTAATLAAAVLSTSFISGIFGMAGGMILMGILLFIMPLPAAMVLHGITQLTANAWRAWLWRAGIRWRIAAYYAVGALAASVVFAAIQIAPSKPVALITLSLLSFVGLWMPGRIAPDITRRWHALACGAICTALQLTAGINGPILDVFFVRSGLDRRTTVATKAAVQSLGHLLKVVYFGQLLLASGDEGVAPVAIGLAVILAVTGTSLARHVLEAISDAQFRRWTQLLIVAVAAASLIQGVIALDLDLSWVAGAGVAGPAA